MIFFSNSNGVITNVEPEQVFQGSNLANTIYLIAPFASSTALTVAFTLPNKIYLSPQLMTLAETSVIVGENDVEVNVWQYLIPSAITNLSGVVDVQFTASYAGDSTNSGLSTMASSFTIAKGVPSTLPEEPTQDIYQAILAYIQTLVSDVDDLSAKYDDKVDITQEVDDVTTTITRETTGELVLQALKDNASSSITITDLMVLLSGGGAILKLEEDKVLANGNEVLTTEDKGTTVAPLENGVVPSDYLPTITTDYEDLTNKPTINGVTVEGALTASNLNLLLQSYSASNYKANINLVGTDNAPVIDMTITNTTTLATVAQIKISSAGIAFVGDSLTLGVYNVLTSQKVGVANGIAPLGTDGKISSEYLPNSIDDVREYDTFADFPTTGETGVIYVDLSTNFSYLWGGTEYVAISNTLALGETSETAYAGNKGKANADNIIALQTTALSLSNSLTDLTTRVGDNETAIGNTDNNVEELDEDVTDLQVTTLGLTNAQKAFAYYATEGVPSEQGFTDTDSTYDSTTRVYVEDYDDITALVLDDTSQNVLLNIVAPFNALRWTDIESNGFLMQGYSALDSTSGAGGFFVACVNYSERYGVHFAKDSTTNYVSVTTNAGTLVTDVAMGDWFNWKFDKTTVYINGTAISLAVSKKTVSSNISGFLLSSDSTLGTTQKTYHSYFTAEILSTANLDTDMFSKRFQVPYEVNSIFAEGAKTATVTLDGAPYIITYYGSDDYVETWANLLLMVYDNTALTKFSLSTLTSSTIALLKNNPCFITQLAISIGDYETQVNYDVKCSKFDTTAINLTYNNGNQIVNFYIENTTNSYGIYSTTSETQAQIATNVTDIAKLSLALANKADLATNEILKLNGTAFTLVDSSTTLTEVEYSLTSTGSVSFTYSFSETTSFSQGDEFNLNLYVDGGSSIFNVELTAELYNGISKIGEVSRSLGVGTDYKSYNLSILLDVDSAFATTDTFTLTLTSNATINLLLGNSIESSYLKFPTVGSVDLTDYATKDYVDTAIQSYLGLIITLDTATEMDNALTDTANAGKLYEISADDGDYIAGVIYKAEE